MLSLLGRIGFVIFLATVLLSACGIDENDFAVDLVAAINDGIIASPETRAVEWEPVTELVTAQRGDLVRTMEFGVHASFTTTRSLTFASNRGVYSGAYVQVGQWVETGELLGEAIVEKSEYGTILRDGAEFQLDSFEATFAEENTARQRMIRETRNAGNTREATRMERQRELFVLQSEHQRNQLQAALDFFEENLLGERIYAPFDGLLTAVSMMGMNTAIAPGHVYFVIADTTHVSFSVRTTMGGEYGAGSFQLVPADAMGPGTVHTAFSPDGLTFELRVVSHQFPRAAMDVLGGSNHVDVNMVPADTEALIAQLYARDMTMADLVGMQLRIVVTETLVHDALLLPLQAIRPEDRAEYVLIYDNGNLAKRYITRGLQLQQYVQILIGVEEGHKVVLRD